jgi:choline dehydrogenase
VLQRSGVGPADALRRLGVEVAVDLPGVGENLHDQPFLLMTWQGRPAMHGAMDRAAAAGAWLPDEQTMAKAASSYADGVFDLHLLPYSPIRTGQTARSWHAGASALLPKSRGRVRITAGDPEAKPLLDHGFLTDPEGHDLAVLCEGIELLRELASQPGLAPLLGRELAPGESLRTRDALTQHLLAHRDNYWHPVGTCKMGPTSDPLAVVDASGAVYGLEGCVVADASLIPVIPRATTAMPVTVVAERVAQALLA